MNANNRLRAVTALLGSLMMAVACGSGLSSTSSSSSQHFFIKIGTADPAGTPEEMSTETFLKEVQQKSGGRIAGQIYLNGQLGTSAAMVTGVEQNTIQMNYTDASFLSGPVPQLAALNLPFLFCSEAAAEKVYDGPIGQSLNQQLIKTAGVRVLGWHSQGSRSFDTVNKPILTAADLKGEKIRVVPAATTIAAYKAWGAVPITLDFSEITTGLRQGTIDGIDQQYITLDAYGWYQAIKYVTESNHQFVMPPLYMNEKFYESLPANLQQVVQQAANDAVKQDRQLAQTANVTSKQKIVAAGIKVSTLDAAVASTLRDAAHPAYQTASDMYGPKFVSDLLAAAKAACTT